MQVSAEDAPYCGFRYRPARWLAFGAAVLGLHLTCQARWFTRMKATAQAPFSSAPGVGIATCRSRPSRPTLGWHDPDIRAVVDALSSSEAKAQDETT
jgi:hypothetical protein